MSLVKQYYDLHKEFDAAFRGKTIKGKEAEKFIKVMEQIAGVYKELNIIMNFVGNRHKNCIEIHSHFTGFLHEMQRSTAEPTS